MFIGQTLTAENAYDESGTPTITANQSIVYTPWFPRGGDAGQFTTEVIAISQPSNDGSNMSRPTLEMTVETKNSEQKDSAATSKGSASLDTSPADMVVEASNASGLLELVRVKFRLYDSDGASILRTYYAVFRLLNPSWVTN